MTGEEIDAAAVKVQHFATRLVRIARSTHKEYSLSSAQYSAMAVLNESPQLSVVELARRERVSHPTMSRLIGGLHAAGLVSHQPDPTDRRSRLLRLTPKGRRLYREVAERRVKLFQHLLSQLSSEAIGEVLALVEKSGPMLERMFDEG